MLVMVKRVGSGTPADPHGVPLPNYAQKWESANGEVWVVDIPPEDAPPFTDAPGSARYPVFQGDQIDTDVLPDPITRDRPRVALNRAVLIGLTIGQRLAWRQKLLARWGNLRAIDAPEMP